MKRCIQLSLLILTALFWALAPRAASHADSKPLSNASCLSCHGDAKLAKQVDGTIVSLFVDSAALSKSMHASLDCVSCHSDIKTLPHASPARVSCGDCHRDARAAYVEGLHAKAVESGNKKAASCTDCHGDGHFILKSSNTASPINHANIAETCGKCHGEKFVMEGTGLTTRPFLSYGESVHGKAVAAGNAKAAVCTQCHGSHDIRPPTDPQSTIFKFSVPKTCGACHSDISAEFSKSIHGQAIARGNSQAPVCTDCHGIHAIKPHVDPASSVASQALARTTCAKCHEGVKLTEEFDVPARRASSYLDSYHGMASNLGSNVVANCASCHGVHNILPSSDPKSMIHSNKLVGTCGKCHPGATENFVLGKIHLNAPLSQDVGSRATTWVRVIYTFLIVLTIGGMLAHNGLIWIRKAKEKRITERRTIVRLTLNQRVQHWLLLSSFFVLVISGFALKYPEPWPAWTLLASESIRRIVHRVAAIVMMGAGVYHLCYLFLTAEGRSMLRAIAPMKKDLSDLVNNLRYYVSGKGHRVKFGRFGYPEKAEYWAVVWGTIVMGATGLMVWFKVEVFNFWPRWSIDIALAIHFYEAILATLAIVVWHFYNVIFDVDVYPLNWALVDGKVSEAYYREEHPLDLERARNETVDIEIKDPGTALIPQ